MSMSKKDYQAVAEIIGQSGNLHEFIELFIQYAQYDNPRFNKEKFRNAIADNGQVMEAVLEVMHQ